MSIMRRFIDPRHQYLRWIDPRVWTLRAGQVEAYLRRKGWTEEPDRPAFRVWREPAADGEAFCQLVPLLEQADDYPQRVFELVTGIAEFEQRPASAILDDILRSVEANGTIGAHALAGA